MRQENVCLERGFADNELPWDAWRLAPQACFGNSVRGVGVGALAEVVGVVTCRRHSFQHTSSKQGESVESVAAQGWRSAADQKSRVRSANFTNLTPFHVASETSGPAVAQPAIESAVLHGTPNPSASSPVVRVR